MSGALLALWLSAAASAAQPAGLLDGQAARELLSDGLRPSASLEETARSGALAEEALQGLRSGELSGSAVAGRADGDAVPPAAAPAASLSVSEPPLPSTPGSGGGPSAEKPKRDWGKLIATWLPVVVAYAIMIQAAINPVGTATYWVRNMALAALIGTGYQLIKEVRKKK